MKERYVILDALRGIALFGICLANYPEFSLYSFLDSQVTGLMPTAGIDRIIRYLQYVFIDGKFYTLFSILFGIGFSIILSNSTDGLKVFYRRMTVLVLIGLFHLIFIWAGDILLLYAVLGFLLPLFRKVSNKKLLIWSAALLVFPILIDSFEWELAAPAISATQYFHGKFGITEANFPVWLAEKDSYLDVLKFNIAGSFIRMQEFIEGNRVFKVLGLFLLGLYIGRNKMYINLVDKKSLLKKICLYGFALGLPMSVLYSWSAMNGHPLGITLHSTFYTISVLPLSLAYTGTLCLWYITNKENIAFKIMAAPGRMSLTNYIMQSVFGMIIFYGTGFGLGATMGLIYVELIAVGVFLLQIICSRLWLNKLRYGPLEWIWRTFTYGKRLK
ncbi:MAG: DUF418 domain-containing protein [Bacteroidales bacterium]|jgi:uncharacterized protein|nr:DUF418 domain-containing protein [Bacteroidales bacterium]